MARVIHFEINAEEPDRAVKFYKQAFGWEIEKWEVPVDYWLIKTGGEDELKINGAIKDRTANNTTVNTIGVQSVDKTLDRIKEAGGKVLMDKTTIPGFGYHAYCEDSERKRFWNHGRGSRS